MKLLQAFSLASLAVSTIVYGAPLVGNRNVNVIRGSDSLQDIVTYDEHSLMVYGQRIYVFSGEFHAYRLPVPDLWLDIFQKIKAMGFSAVSFYIDMALLEGEQDVYRAEGIFALEPFFQAASEAGIYLIARPGPYINAESSGGGYPGWFARIKGKLRTRDADYMNATNNYIANVGAAIARAQITNGGPVILVQPENEYSQAVVADDPYPFPDPEYIAEVQAQYRKAGILVPYISNDSSVKGGILAPGSTINGSTLGDWDIWGHDSYPLGFDCSHTDDWAYHDGGFPASWHERQLNLSPSTPDAITEFQGGTFDPWGGFGYENCAALFNEEYERVFNKNNFAASVTIMNLYMTYGGTNWGHISYPPAYTSYDYGSTIAENRVLSREKYYEIKLEANFLRVSPAYLTASTQNLTNGTYTSTDAISTTPLFGNGSITNFYVLRHADWITDTSVPYTLNLPTSKGNLRIPQLNGSLTLSGRDSKWHVTDYDVGGTNLLYSTAEIFTWKAYEHKKVLIVYGGPNEQHELALSGVASNVSIVEGSGVTTKSTNGTIILNWKTSTGRRVAKTGSLFIYILDRNTAYNYWVIDLERSDYWGNYTTNIGNTTSVIVEAGYLLRNAEIDGTALKIVGDLNATVPLNVIGAPTGLSELFFNGVQLQFTTDSASGEWSTSIGYTEPTVEIPDLEKLDWKYLDDLPEIQSSYDDSLWTVADLNTTNNPTALQTPTSLYNTDYGYNAGMLIYRGRFVATGNESTLLLETQGGMAYGDATWLNSIFLGSYAGAASTNNGTNNSTYTLPNIKAGATYILTVVVQNSGLEEDPNVAEDYMKRPRGIMYYELSGRPQSAITWKLTGNLGGEKYIDKVRGPLNEGGLYAQRQGFHQPYPPSANWTAGKPTTGITKPGIALYTTSFDLDLPRGYDIPLSFNIGNTTVDGNPGSTPLIYRAQLWVNGYQFGRYSNHLGPQTSFPVPQGILDYYGTNWVAIELWAQETDGAYLESFTLEAGQPVLTGMKTPSLSPMPPYSQRAGAY